MRVLEKRELEEEGNEEERGLDTLLALAIAKIGRRVANRKNDGKVEEESIRSYLFEDPNKTLITR